MQIEVRHADFTRHHLAVQPCGLLRGPKLLLDGAPVERKRGKYSVTGDSGSEIAVELRNIWVDPVPRLKIAGEPVELAPPLKSYEYAWAGVPLLLVFAGGAIGGLFGGLGAMVSGRIFRSDRGALAKYGLTLLVTLGAAVAYFVVAVAFRILIGANR